MNNEQKSIIITGLIITIGVILGIAVIWGGFALSAIYNVWSSGLAGEAELKQADWNRQIAVREALAKKESAIALAQAEIERAKGVSQANKIIGDSLKNNEEYLRYLWIDGLQNTENQVIYIPTEGNLPILEANRFKSK